jgi:hypothetical protein
MAWQDIIYIVVFVVIWYLLVAKILPRFGIGS